MTSCKPKYTFAVNDIVKVVPHTNMALNTPPSYLNKMGKITSISVDGNNKIRYWVSFCVKTATYFFESELILVRKY